MLTRSVYVGTLLCMPTRWLLQGAGSSLAWHLEEVTVTCGDNAWTFDSTLVCDTAVLFLSSGPPTTEATPSMPGSEPTHVPGQMFTVCFCLG